MPLQLRVSFCWRVATCVIYNPNLTKLLKRLIQIVNCLFLIELAVCFYFSFENLLLLHNAVELLTTIFCRNYQNEKRNERCDRRQCIPGCHCPAGHVIKRGKCIKASSCHKTKKSHHKVKNNRNKSFPIQTLSDYFSNERWCVVLFKM